VYRRKYRMNVGLALDKKLERTRLATHSKRITLRSTLRST
jgi:hypothetical protein